MPEFDREEAEAYASAAPAQGVISDGDNTGLWLGVCHVQKQTCSQGLTKTSGSPVDTASEWLRQHQ